MALTRLRFAGRFLHKTSASETMEFKHAWDVAMYPKLHSQ